MIVTVTLTLFFHFNLTYVSTKFEKAYIFYDYNNVNFCRKTSFIIEKKVVLPNIIA